MSTEKKIKIARSIIVSILILMIVIDVILVFSAKKGFPTFSKVVSEHRPPLIWLTFLFGGLMAKIYFYKPSIKWKSDLYGFLGLLLLEIILFVTGFVLNKESDPILIALLDSPLFQLCLLISGGLYAHYFWPQYIRNK